MHSAVPHPFTHWGTVNIDCYGHGSPAMMLPTSVTSLHFVARRAHVMYVCTRLLYHRRQQCRWPKTTGCLRLSYLTRVLHPLGALPNRACLPWTRQSRHDVGQLLHRRPMRVSVPDCCTTVSRSQCRRSTGKRSRRELNAWRR